MKIDATAEDVGPLTPAAARAEFDADLTYLDTAAVGLPPRCSWMALQQALAQWRAGTADAVAYDVPVAAARSAYAHLVGADPSAVAVGSQVSVFAGLIAANLPDGSEVLTATGDFTSILFPFYAQSGRGIHVREAPLEHIAERRHLPHHAGRGLRGAVRRRAGRRSRCPARGQPRHRGQGAAGHHPGRRVAASRREPLRVHRLRRVQMAALPQRHRLLHRQLHADRRPDTAFRRLVCRR